MKRRIATSIFLWILTGPPVTPLPLSAQTTSDAWVVHATDPHLLVDSKDGDATVIRQRELNRASLANLLKWMSRLPASERTVRLLVLTGDFDVDPCWWSPPGTALDDCIKNVPAAARTDMVARLGDLLSESPIEDVYLLPGNNDIAHESAGDTAITYFNDFIAEVQARIATRNRAVRLHNFGRCDAGGDDARCYADVGGTSYRLVALPSYSFKNRSDPNSYVSNSPIQEQQIGRFARLVEEARTAGKKVLVVTHVPEIDDPFTLAQDRYAGKPLARQGPAVPNQSPWSTWGVSKAVLDQWRGVFALESVAGVIAGHLHDSHKEVYRQPYPWSRQNEYRDYRKLFITPPLAVKLQDASPIQARGASLIHLLPDRVERQLYWYEDQTGAFSSDDVTSPRDEPRRTRPFAQLRNSFWKVAAPGDSLDRWAVLFIAMLAAYLTVVRVWEIPPPENPLSKTPAAPTSGATKAEGGNRTESRFEPSPFASNFGQTIVAGLAGLAAEAVLKSLEGKPAAADKEFYIVWFVFLLFLMLFGFAAVRAFVEGLRARVLFIHYSFVPPAGQETKAVWRRFRRWTWNGWQRWLSWLRSLGVPLLTFLDTLINLIQGKNQTVTRVFGQALADQHENVLRVADVVRARLTEVIEAGLDQSQDGKAGRVRVSISAMSADQSSVFYISRAPGSATRAFPRRSVAWVSVFTGKIRWFKTTYGKDKDIVLFDNTGGWIEDEDHVKLPLSGFFQQRDQDYEAFVVFPVPWPQRGFASDFVKGGIHISFRYVGDFEKIWSSSPASNGLDSMLVDHEYKHEERMLDEWCQNKEVRTAFGDAIAVLGELLKSFNENLYRSRGRI